MCLRKLYGLLESPSLPPSIPTHQFKLFLVGRTGSGKTCLVSWLAGLQGVPTAWESKRDQLLWVGTTGVGNGKLGFSSHPLRAKFAQHPRLRAMLLETGSRRLVEHTENDEAERGVARSVKSPR